MKLLVLSSLTAIFLSVCPGTEGDDSGVDDSQVDVVETGAGIDTGTGGGTDTLGDASGQECEFPESDTLTFVDCVPAEIDFALPIIQAWMVINFVSHSCQLMAGIPSDHGQVDDFALDVDPDDTFTVVAQTLRLPCASHGTRSPGAYSDAVMLIPSGEEVVLEVASDDGTKHGYIRATFVGPELSARVAGVGVAFQ